MRERLLDCKAARRVWNEQRADEDVSPESPVEETHMPK
jgi:hypothetical protein